MTRPSPQEIERWRANLAADSTASGKGDCPPAESIWTSAGGESVVAGDEVLEHVFDCGACAAAWRAARELQQAAQTELARAPRVSVPFRWALAASVIVAVLVVPLLLRRAASPPSPFRAAEGPQIIASSPASLPRDGFVLEWSGAPEGSTHDVRVTTVDLDPVTSAFGLSEPRLQIPAGSLSGLASGDALLWQVTSHLPDGRRLVSVTFSTTLR